MFLGFDNLQEHSGKGCEMKDLGFNILAAAVRPSTPKLLLRCSRTVAVQLRFG